MSVRKCVKKDVKLKYAHVETQHRRFSTIVLSHLMEDYLTISWNCNLRLQRRGLSLGAPQREYEVANKQRLHQFPGIGGDNVPKTVVGGPRFKECMEEMTKSDFKQWKGLDLVYRDPCEFQQCLDEMWDYAEADMRNQTKYLKEGNAVCASLQKLELHEFVMNYTEPRYFVNDLDGPIRLQYHGFPAKNLTLDIDKAIKDLEVFKSLHAEKVESVVGKRTVMEAIAAGRLDLLEKWQEAPWFQICQSKCHPGSQDPHFCVNCKGSGRARPTSDPPRSHLDFSTDPEIHIFTWISKVFEPF
jgi:hypothetical protein